MMHDRVLELEGVHNFRDYGGYATVGGGRVKRGLLWRSGQHFGATAADLKRIGALGLATVIDLRGNSEREESPCPRPVGFSAEVRFHDGETAALAPHLEAAEGVIDAAGAHQAMIALYDEIAFRPSLTGILREYFAFALSRQEPSLVHCHAGKDRTGIAVALVHHALGVHPDDIVEDYMLTNTAGNNEKRIAAMLSRRPESGAYANVSADAVRVMMNVDEEFLAAAFSAIRRDYGSVDSYLEQVLGVDAAARAGLRARLVETA